MTLLETILSGSLATAVIGLITIGSTVRKARSEANRVEAEADSVRIGNDERATRILVENIVLPLKEELNATRKDLQATKREMVRLRKAIDSASACPHSGSCPILFRMRLAADECDTEPEQAADQDQQNRHHRPRDDHHNSPLSADTDDTPCAATLHT